MLTYERLKEVVTYDPNTGEFSWRAIRPGTRGKVGYTRTDGYTIVTIDRTRVLAHRLAIFYVTGVMPVGDVDHKDGNPRNNAFENLRECERTDINHQNLKKAHRDSFSGDLGVSFHARDKLWRARIYTAGKTRTWYFKRKQDARRKYIEEKRKLHAGCLI